MKTSAGKVWLVGAGPGDPDLLTCKALRLLEEADVVLHDDLVSPEILALIPHATRKQNVGKRCGKKNIQQEEINALLVSFAQFGLKVVRLKSGDPMIFGRAGEEMEAMRRAGVDFEVVPGITSALGAAASAKISLTHRQAASAVAFLTSHQAKNAKAADWQAWVRARATLVIYMPGYEYSQIATRLTDAGMPETTACAVVSRATAKDEQILRTTLGALPGAARMAAPTLLFVGEAVGLTEAGEPAVDLERLAAQSAFAEQVSPAPELWFWPQEFSGD
jgi:uroporphyrin-III C-methyltransferase